MSLSGSWRTVADAKTTCDKLFEPLQSGKGLNPEFASDFWLSLRGYAKGLFLPQIPPSGT